MMNRLTPLWTALLLVGPFAAAVGQSSDRARFVGCYAVALGAWTPLLDHDEQFHRVPPHIRLDTAVGDHGVGRLSPNIQYPYPSTVKPQWIVRRDTLLLNWSDGFVPTSMALAGQDSLLVGDAVAKSDAIAVVKDDANPVPRPPHWPHARVTLRREVCTVARPASRELSNER